MIFLQTNVYTLPEISFVGGETQEFNFHLKNSSGHDFDASGAQIDFAICNYSNKTGVPLLNYTPTLLADETGVASVVHLVIPKGDTAELSGKFIYQITIIDISGDAEIPNQGIMNIAKNIHQDYVL